MLNDHIAKKLNEQIKNELYSAYLYLDIANYYSEQGLEGFENWFYIQAQEERDHAMLIRTYLLNNGEKVTLHPIESPKESYADFGAPLKRALEHEKLVTGMIHNIFEAAMLAKDFRTTGVLGWFIQEQGEEEKSACDLITRYELFGKDSKAGLYALDQEMKARSYSPPGLVLD